MKTLALGKKESHAYKSMDSIMGEFGEVVYREEKKLLPHLLRDMRAYLRQEGFDRVLMPNPYGNAGRLSIYRKLKEIRFPLLTFDRGALPKSWFFDIGFNADSPTYHPINWDVELGEEKEKEILAYIDRVKFAEKPLERQSEQIRADEFRARLRLPKEKKILFVAFQRPSDTTITHFAKDIGGAEGFNELVNGVQKEILQAKFDWILIGKKHPLERNRPNVAIPFFHDEENINNILEIADMILTVNSGCGVLASLWDKPVLYAGDVFYGHPQLNQKVRSVSDVLYWLKNPFSIEKEKRNRFIFYLFKKVYSFGKFETELVEQRDGSLRNITKKITFECLRLPKITPQKSILFASPVVPFPITRGSAHRVDQMIRAMLDLGHKVHLMILNHKDTRDKHEICEALIREYNTPLFSVELFQHPNVYKRIWAEKKNPITMCKVLYSLCYDFYNKNIVRNKAARINSYKDTCLHFSSALQKKAVKFDMLWIDYAKLYPIDGIKARFTVIDLNDVQSNRIINEFRMKNERIDSEYISSFVQSEKNIIETVDLNITISKIEYDYIRNEYCKNANIFLINATDSDHMYEIYKNKEYDLVFIGSNSSSNIDGIKWFLETIWEEIKKKVIGVTLLIQGNVSKNKNFRKFFESYSSDTNIHIQEYVENLDSVYEKTKICICPLRFGTGMKIKNIEAMAHGIPVVSTSVGLEGIRTGTNFRGYDSIEAFGTIIEKLLSDQCLYGTYRDECRQVFEDNHSRSYLMEKMRDLFAVYDSKRSKW